MSSASGTPPLRSVHAHPPGAAPVYEAASGQPLVTRHGYGKGHVIVTTPDFLLGKKPVPYFTGRRQLELRQLVCFAPHFLKKLFL